MHSGGSGAVCGGSALPRSTLRLVARGRGVLLRLLSSGSIAVLAQKALPTASGFALGDVLTQQLGPLWPADPWPTKHNPALHDPYKTAAMAAVGAGVAAPVSLLLYRAMDLAAPGTAPLLVAAKFTVEQVVGCVLWQAAYCALHDRYRATLLDWLATKHNAGRQNAAARVGSPAVSRVSTPAC